MTDTFRVVEPFVVGVQLARLQTPAALVVVMRSPTGGERNPARHEAVFAQRWPVATTYPVVVADLVHLLSKKPPAPRKKFDPMATTPKSNPLTGNVACLIVNATGVPEAALELMRAADPDLLVLPAWVTSGDHSTQSASGLRVPHADLIGVVQVLQQQDRLGWAHNLPERETLLQQLEGYEVEDPKPGRRERYATAEHDDLATALALAVWWGELMSPAIIEEVPTPFRAWSPEALQAEMQRRRVRATPTRATGGPLPESLG